MLIDYESRKQAILASKDIEELRRSQNMPPVPLCQKDQNFVFISYSHKDYKAVYCDLLEFHKNGLRYWYDEGLPAGEAWDKVVEGQIKHPHCAGVIFYMSENLFLSRSVNKEVEFTVSGGEDGGEVKNYFCINLSDMPPMKIIFTIQRTQEYEQLEQSGFIDCLPCLTTAFSNKATYIPKSGDADFVHIAQTLKQIRERFGVFIDGMPIENDEEVQKLAKELAFTKKFAVKDGVLLKYMGEDTEIVIPDGITEIGRDAFYNSTEITKVIIPEGVTSIDMGAFNSCFKLESCNIPNSVTRINKYAFHWCVRFLQTYQGGKYIDKWLIEGSALQGEIAFRPDTKHIADSAFEDCKNLMNVIIPNSIATIGSRAFDGCSGLSCITIPDNVIHIGDHAFSGCSSLTSIAIPSSIKHIDDCMFYGCTALTSITIPGSINNIGYGAFYECSGLTNIHFDGTIGQWNAIEKIDSWNSGTGNYIIHCIDGDIPKST